MTTLRKVLTVALLVIGGSLIAGIALAKLSRGTTMSAAKVESRWGSKKFAPEAFKAGGVEVRAQMAADLMRTNPYKGKSTLEVRQALGDWEGFYHFDMFPAYIFSDKGEEAWQLVFLLDRNNLVKEVIAHKNGTPASYLR